MSHLEVGLRLDGLAVRIVWCDGSKSASHMGVEDLKPVHVTGVDPAKSKNVSEFQSHKAAQQTYPSRGAPLKSTPWFPYSASTR